MSEWVRLRWEKKEMWNLTFEVKIQLLERLPTDPTSGGNERPATPVKHVELFSDAVRKK